MGGGAMLNGWFLRTIRKTDVPIRTDKPVPRLTTEGPFRYSRNRSYLALAMIYAGIAFLLNSLWAILFLPLVVVVMQREVSDARSATWSAPSGRSTSPTRGRCDAGSRSGKPPGVRNGRPQLAPLGVARFVKGRSAIRERGVRSPWPGVRAPIKMIPLDPDDLLQDVLEEEGWITMVRWRRK